MPLAAEVGRPERPAVDRLAGRERDDREPAEVVEDPPRRRRRSAPRPRRRPCGRRTPSSRRCGGSRRSGRRRTRSGRRPRARSSGPRWPAPASRRPAASTATPLWSQRVTRVWRVASSGSNAPEGRAAASVIVSSPSSTPATLRSSPGQAVELAPVVGHLDPVADRDPGDRVAADAGRRQLRPRRVDPRDGERDRRVVAGPLERRRPERAVVVDLDPVQPVLGSAVAAGRRHRAGVVVDRDADRRGRQPAGRGRGERRSRRNAPTSTSSPRGTSSRRTCQAVWSRVAVSTAIAFSTSSGSSSAVTSRRQTSR